MTANPDRQRGANLRFRAQRIVVTEYSGLRYNAPGNRDRSPILV
jgi:hypothetical protein